MSAPTPQERDLFAELTRMLMEMKDAPHARVQAAIEERFRSYLKAERTLGASSLQITWTCSLPEGSESFAIYRTEYRILDTSPQKPGTEGPAPVRLSAKIIPFPGL